MDKTQHQNITALDQAGRLYLYQAIHMLLLVKPPMHDAKINCMEQPLQYAEKCYQTV